MFGHRTLFCLLVFVASSAAQDGLPLSRGNDNYTLDDSIDDGTDVFVTQWLSSQSQGFGPLGSSRYQGEVQVLHRLYGNCPETVPCYFKVWTVPKPDITWKVPEPGDIRLVMGKYHEDQKILSIRRFIEPTAENIQLVANVIRQHKAKELAADPVREKQLTEGLAAALKVAVVTPSDKVKTKQEEGGTQADNDFWWWLCGGTGVVLAVVIVVWRLKRTRGT